MSRLQNTNTVLNRQRWPMSCCEWEMNRSADFKWVLKWVLKGSLATVLQIVRHQFLKILQQSWNSIWLTCNTFLFKAHWSSFNQTVERVSLHKAPPCSSVWLKHPHKCELGQQYTHRFIFSCQTYKITLHMKLISHDKDKTVKAVKSTVKIRWIYNRKVISFLLCPRKL